MEVKLAKQRQKKSEPNLGVKIATPFAHNGINAIDETRIASEIDKSCQLTSSLNQLPPHTSPINQLSPLILPTTTTTTTTPTSTSIDDSLRELRLKDVRKPPPVLKKSTSSVSYQFSK